ncbi:MAG TPA: aminoglycoside phosphotransferase family protein [Ktedonobacterales bacterium]|jgi:streptomycin 6-kinase|nr:aminoglycoside phosphotransferase family protein [Ktedonobacterales bacterium]
MSEFTIPDYFAAFVADYWGDEGAAWIAALPALLEEYALQWDLSPLPPFPGLTYNYVTPVMRVDGSPAVLKTGVPGDEFRASIAFLRLCEGHGAVRLLEGDAERCVMLMERAFPGVPLARLDDDDAATVIGADVMREFWRPAPAPSSHPFPTVAHWLRAFERVRALYGGASGPLPERLLARAESLAGDLLVSAPYERLMHGDLHHDNIVSAEREPWLVIDPKGLVGDPGYETGPFINNPYGRMETWRDPARNFARRADIFAERLSYPRDRILAWGFVQAVLSAAWYIEDGSDRFPPSVARAEVLATLL